MAYSKQTWDTTSYVNPTRMNHIEAGIEAVDSKFNTNKGSAVRPIYLENGVLKQTSYALNKTVPTDAVFTDTTYSSQSAASGGTDVSLCTTGEKYTWNNKANKNGSTSNNFSVKQLTAANVVNSNTTEWFPVQSNGGLVCYNNNKSAYAQCAASAFNNPSSRRYKENIEDMTEEYAKKILELRPVSYDYIEKANGTNCYGMIAEEVAEIETYPVAYNEGQVEGLDYAKFVPQLIKMVQIQQREIEELKSKLK